MKILRKTILGTSDSCSLRRSTQRIILKIVGFLKTCSPIKIVKSFNNDYCCCLFMKFTTKGRTVRCSFPNLMEQPLGSRTHPLFDFGNGGIPPGGGWFRLIVK